MYQPLIKFHPHPAIFTQVLCIFEPLETVYFAEERGKGRCDLLSF